ncbi:MAG: glycosyltransferase [Coprobacter sp.]|nr:glycosyltransferase [Coprobacter sp.]
MEKYLGRCIDSILNQTFTDFELLLINDGSNDSSSVICDKYASVDKRIKVINKQNEGISRTRQLGLDLSKGDYIIYCDSDDYVESDMLMNLFHKAKETDADLVWCDYKEDKNEVCKYIRQSGCYLNSGDLIRGLLSQKLHGSTWNKLIKRNLVQSKIYFDFDLAYCEDLFFNIQLLNKFPNIKISYVPQAFYHYYQRESSITHKKNAMFFFLNVSLLIEKISVELQIKEEDTILYNFKKFALQCLFGAKKYKLLLNTYPEIHTQLLHELPFWSAFSFALRGYPNLGRYVGGIIWRIEKYLCHFTGNKKIITFLLPCEGSIPSGGFKVVYEYANRLVSDGYKVNIMYPVRSKIKDISFLNRLRICKLYFHYLINGYSGKAWFSLNAKVKERLVLNLNQRRVPVSDYYVATAISTAYCLNEYNVDIRKKLYLIQGFENWEDYKDEDVYDSYRFGFENIVISSWLAERVKESGANYTLIKNGFDFEYFKFTNPIEKRNPFHVSMMYHWSARKGCDIGLEALRILKLKYPQLSVTFFGTPSPPEGIPRWITYYQSPDKITHNRIYNESAIYLAPSLQEGWGLTIGEAMICGCAIVCTDTLGFKEMVVDGETGLIAPTGNAEALADKMEMLFKDDSFRQNIAKKGNISIQQFSWESSYRKFLELVR